MDQRCWRAMKKAVRYPLCTTRQLLRHSDFKNLISFETDSGNTRSVIAEQSSESRIWVVVRSMSRLLRKYHADSAQNRSRNVPAARIVDRCATCGSAEMPVKEAGIEHTARQGFHVAVNHITGTMGMRIIEGQSKAWRFSTPFVNGFERRTGQMKRGPVGKIT